MEFNQLLKLILGLRGMDYYIDKNYVYHFFMVRQAKIDGKEDVKLYYPKYVSARLIVEAMSNAFKTGLPSKGFYAKKYGFLKADYYSNSIILIGDLLSIETACKTIEMMDDENFLKSWSKADYIALDENDIEKIEIEAIVDKKVYLGINNKYNYCAKEGMIAERFYSGTYLKVKTVQGKNVVLVLEKKDGNNKEFNLRLH